MKQQLRSGAMALGIELKDEQLSQFEHYYHLLAEWNKKINLTAITNQEDVVQKHFLDSISCLQTGVFQPNMRVIDVGAGAGFPSIPIKICRSDLDFTLVDSLQKRVRFLQTAFEALSLSRICAQHGRAEETGQGALRECFDIALARGVAPLNVLCELCMPHIKLGGYFVAMKGSNFENELQLSDRAIKILGGMLVKIMDSGIVGLEHKIILVQKIQKSPTQYPRKAGIPSKNPL